MAQKKSASGYLGPGSTIAENRRARFDYFLEQHFEAGLALTGTEVKSLRLGQCSLNEAYAAEHNGELYLYNCNIPEYGQAGAHLQHAPKRPRKLLLNKKEVHKLMGAVTRDGYTVVPVRLYFNNRNMAKLDIALAKGKQTVDKRQDVKKRDWDREKARVMRNKH
jgi:SsrA-binding protein